MTSDNPGDSSRFEQPHLDVDHPTTATPPAAPSQAATPPATTPPEAFGDKVNRFARKFAIGLVFVGLAVITYFILANFLPQWWAQRIAERVSGRFSSGIWVGFTLGFASTLIPIICLILAVINRGKLKNIPTLGFVVLAVLTAIPNLLTLSIVFGRTDGAYRGQYILDVNGPGFRGGGVWGAILAAVVGAIVGYYIWRFRRRGKQLSDAKAANAELNKNPPV